MQKWTTKRLFFIERLAIILLTHRAAYATHLYGNIFKTQESRISQCGARASGNGRTLKRKLLTTTVFGLLIALASLRAGPHQGGCWQAAYEEG